MTRAIAKASETAAAPGRSADSVVWGLSALSAHDRWWASRSVQIVRPGDEVVAKGPRLYVLMEAGVAAVFPLRGAVRRLEWLRARALRVRIVEEERAGYRETVEEDAAGDFRAIRRRYWARVTRDSRAVITPDPRLAELWSRRQDTADGWRAMRRAAGRENVSAMRVVGRVFHVENEHEEQALLDEMQRRWTHISPLVEDVYALAPGVWAHFDARIDERSRLAPPVWIGAGASVEAGETLVGPIVVGDAPDRRPEPGVIAWEEALAPHWGFAPSRGPSVARRVSKRLFDIAFSVAALALTAPLYPLIIAAIVIEDGWPAFFTHRRQTRGGREFPCYKFRTMCKDAETMKSRLARQNAADGPQFYIRDDPRLLRVGRFLRATQLDEIPQFWNVLLGHMSVVGPRPSPDKENQCCPTWREARLSVRPGITGLWQIKRTRAPETDFQEWIRFDLEYVQRQSWRLDLWILAKTVRKVLRG